MAAGHRADAALDEELKELIRARLASFDVLRADNRASPCAVAVPVVEEGTGAVQSNRVPFRLEPRGALLLTRGAAHAARISGAMGVAGWAHR